jgi:hypothetical protein
MSGPAEWTGLAVARQSYIPLVSVPAQPHVAFVVNLAEPA